MIKVIQRGANQAYEEGVTCLRELLQKHLGELPLDSIFEPSALEFLLKYSGGHVRHLMTFAQAACAYTDELPIPLNAAHRAIQQTVRTYSASIPETHWQKLAKLDTSPYQTIDSGDEDYLLMLEQLSVLEYINGGSEEPFAQAEPWYAVNPIVRELQKFKAAKLTGQNEAK